MSSQQNGVIEISSGNLLRCGCCDFSDDYDPATEALRSDVPCPGLRKWAPGETEMHRWTGSAWILVAQPPGPTNICHDYIHLQDQKAQGTDGGTFAQDAWRTRVLTAKVADTGDNCVLSSDQFTLGAGTYEISVTAPANSVAQHQSRLYNISDAAVELLGTCAYCGTYDGGTIGSFIRGRFTISVPKIFKIQHYCLVTKTNDGFGVKANLTTEIYTDVVLWKVA